MTQPIPPPEGASIVRTRIADIYVNHLSYDDAVPRPKKFHLDYLNGNMSAQRYAAELDSMFDDYGQDVVTSEAEKGVDELADKLETFGLQPTNWSSSKSWFLWHSAKERYLANNPTVQAGMPNSDQYDPVDPFLYKKDNIPISDAEKSKNARDAIIYTQLGWELHPTGVSNPDNITQHLDQTTPPKVRERIIQLATELPQEGRDTLSAYKLHQLGELVWTHRKGASAEVVPASPVDVAVSQIESILANLDSAARAEVLDRMIITQQSETSEPEGAQSDDVGGAPQVEDVPTQVEDPTQEGSELAYTIDQIEASVVSRGIFGKFPPGTSMKDTILVESNRGLDEYGAYPDDMNIAQGSNILPPNNKIYRVANIIREAVNGWQYPQLKPVSDKHIIAFGETNDPNLSVVDMFFLTDVRDRAGRASGYAHTLFVLPNDNAKQLETLIRANPDAAEMFFQKAAAGLETKDPTTRSGIGRIKSNQLAIIDDVAALFPDDLIAESTGKDSAWGPDYFNDSRFSRLFNARFSQQPLSVTTLNYNSGPYGTVDGSPFINRR